jgi:hypothetical protein
LRWTITAISAAGLTLAGVSAAHAENWYAFYMTPQGAAYVDKDSVIFRPGHVSARVQSTFPQPVGVDKGDHMLVYTHVLDTIDIDCKAGVYRFVARDLYNDAGDPHMTISQPDNPALIQDRSIQDVLAKAYCPKK